MNFYLKKYGFIPSQILEKPPQNLGISVVIPCFNEPDLITSLNSLANNLPTEQLTEVIVVLNSGELAEDDQLEQNLQTKQAFNEFKANHQSDFIHFHCIHVENLPKKHAGVGLARKIGMDEAVARFHALNKDGIIVCFDADSTVSPNYLSAIEKHFDLHPKTPGVSIAFEHPIAGREFSIPIYEGIINYELHLRYYNQCLKYANLPYAFHTVGSSMAVRSSAYQKQGGMNKRKAGEDFYFIHKIIALGNFTELTTTRVIPSPRISDRVPFGTGRAIGEWIESDMQDYQTYNFEIFLQIKNFVTKIQAFSTETYDFADLSPSFIQFLTNDDFTVKVGEMKNNTKNFEAFEKRFFTYFDAFKVLKLVHFMRDNGYPNQKLLTSTNHLLSVSFGHVGLGNCLDQLLYLRRVENKSEVN